MTKYRRKIAEHVEERWKEGKTLCDFCHRDLENVRQSWDYNEIELSAKIGSCYPEGDSREGYELDCCSECFLDKVKPALEALGVKWKEFSPEDSYITSNYGDYWVDDVPRTDGRYPSDLEAPKGGSHA